MSDQEETGVTEATEETTAPVEATADMSTDEIMDIASKRQDEAEEESPASEDTQEGTSEKDVKTEVSDDKEAEPEETKHEESIPYDRFKSVNDKVEALETKHQEQLTELERYRSLLNNGQTIRTAMENAHYTEDEIVKYMQDNGIEEVKDPSVDEDYDLNTIEGWEKKNESLVEKKIAPILDFMKRAEAREQESSKQKQVEQRMQGEETDAKKLCVDVYNNLEFGVIGKDEKNPETAVGKISSYLDAHPDKAQYGYADLLTLAMSADGFKGAVDKGKQAEKERIRKVKAAAMESDDNITAGEQPDPNWSTEKLMEWAATHNA